MNSKKLIEVIENIQHNREFKKNYKHNKIDVQLMENYFLSLNERITPSHDLLEKLEYLSNNKNSNIMKIVSKNLYKLFSEKDMLWCISHSKHDLNVILNSVLRRNIDNNIYNLNIVIENLCILDNNIKSKQTFIKNLFLIKDINKYNYLDRLNLINEEEKKEVVKNILQTKNDSIYLHKEIIKDIFIRKIDISNYIKSLTPEKLNFFINIYLEIQEENTNNKDNIRINKITNNCILSILNRGFLLKNENLINESLKIIEDKPIIKEINLILIRKSFSYLKKPKAIYYTNKIIDIMYKKNQNLYDLKDAIYSNCKNYNFSEVGMRLSFDNDYFRTEMIKIFNQQLNHELPNNQKSKINKI